MSERISSFIDRLNQAIFRWVAWLTAVMAITMFGIVFLRYGFGYGSVALQESISYFHGFVFMLASAYALQANKHVRVDIFYQRFGQKGKAWVNLLGTLFLLFPVCGFIAYISFDYVQTSWSLLEGSREAGGIDGVFLLKSLIPLFSILMCLQGFSEMLKAVAILRGVEHGR